MRGSSVASAVVDTAAYLARIGLNGPPPIDVDGLERLQRAHLTHVAFENLDVYHRRGVSTDPDRSVDKIVVRGRGGWCFELNGGFAALLGALGFATTVLGATVSSTPDASPQPDHATIRVDLDHPYLVDVGFGDSFIRPLRLDLQGPQDGGIGDFDLVHADGLVTLRSFSDGEPHPEYRFTLAPADPSTFEPSSHHLQTAPDTLFTAKPFATRLIDGGPDRVTLLRDRLRFRSGGVWTEAPVADAEWPRVLAHWFGMEP
jgi:N-hydroxyarylamine O-acetyltransferase